MKSASRGQVDHLARLIAEDLAGTLFADEIQGAVSDSKKVEALRQIVYNGMTEAFDLNPYRQEKTKRRADYPCNCIPEVAVQMERLAEQFHGIRFGNAKLLTERLIRPEGADGKCAALIPTLAFLGRYFGIANPYELGGYGNLVRLIDYKISPTSGIEPHVSEVLNDLRLAAEFVDRQREIEVAVDKEQRDVYVAYVSMGRYFAGWSSRATRYECLRRGMLPLGSAQSLALALSVKERIRVGLLSLDCAAGEEACRGGDDWKALGLVPTSEIMLVDTGSTSVNGYWGDIVAWLGV